MPRRYTWDQFEVLLKDNPNVLNYPLFLACPHDQPLNKIPGYQEIDVDRWQVKEVMDGQP